MNTDKYHQAVAESTVTTDDAAVKSAVEEIIAKHFQENNTPEVHKFLFNTIDLTTLNSTDSPQSVARGNIKMTATDSPVSVEKSNFAGDNVAVVVRHL